MSGANSVQDITNYHFFGFESKVLVCEERTGIWPLVDRIRFMIRADSGWSGVRMGRWQMEYGDPRLKLCLPGGSSTLLKM
jgi:hypothetical protein